MGDLERPRWREILRRATAVDEQCRGDSEGDLRDDDGCAYEGVEGCASLVHSPVELKLQMAGHTCCRADVYNPDKKNEETIQEEGVDGDVEGRMNGCKAAREEEGVVAGEGPGESGCGLVDCVEGDGGDDDEGGHEDCGGCRGAGGFFPDEVDGESRRVEGGVETGEHELRRGEAGQEGDAVGPAAGAIGELRPDGPGVDLGVGAGGTGDGDGDEGSEGEQNCWMTMSAYRRIYQGMVRREKGGEHTARIVDPEGSVGEKDVVDNHDDVEELIYQKVMPRMRHILRLPADNHGHERLRRSHRNRRRECDPREHGCKTTKVRQTATPSLRRQNRGEMVLSACGGIDAGQLRQGDTRAQHGNSDSDDTVEQ
ncbi:hypothetical protein IFM46972_06841 [Aspergillus udagawae]|uniref:Uncharacterized protein n=1 Tax=Aspergillus udagawae TaxID=91492 RepID=A0A8H3S3U4_9EURO|nr:hypothetical protein IFM46972_06841 [Aspergillus udagawae]